MVRIWDYWGYGYQWIFNVFSFWVLVGSSTAIALKTPRYSISTRRSSYGDNVGDRAPIPVIEGSSGASPTNSFAIVSLVLGILGISVLAVIFGHIALGQIKRTGESGRGLALTGTILGWLGIAITAALLIGLVTALNSFPGY